MTVSAFYRGLVAYMGLNREGEWHIWVLIERVSVVLMYRTERLRVYAKRLGYFGLQCVNSHIL